MKIIVLIALVALTSCANDPISQAQTNNPAVPVSLLFEHDGCKIYRFQDNKFHYFAKCQDAKAMTMTDYDKSCGKNCVKHVSENIETK